MRLVDADKFRSELDNHYPFTKDEQSKHGMADIAKSTVLFVLNAMPTVDAAPVVHGHWIPCHPLGDNTPEGYMCSVCHVGGWEKTNFCPHCNAKMDGKGNGNETN